MKSEAQTRSENIDKQLGCELPFCFYTNGYETYFWDLENCAPRKVVGFPTRDDLERFQYIRHNRKPLPDEPINTSIAGRDCQIRTIRAVLEGIEQKKRNFLTQNPIPSMGDQCTARIRHKGLCAGQKAHGERLISR
jgi:type I restriction enzyme, R subunit